MKKKVGRPIHLPSPWGELARALGGTKKLSERLLVSGATINRWANKVHDPSGLVKKEVRKLCKIYKIKTNL